MILGDLWPPKKHCPECHKNGPTHTHKTGGRIITVDVHNNHNHNNNLQYRKWGQKKKIVSERHLISSNRSGLMRLCEKIRAAA
jgi:hypothetical protein